jgi:hypothetical protein
MNAADHQKKGESNTRQQGGSFQTSLSITHANKQTNTHVHTHTRARALCCAAYQRPEVNEHLQRRARRTLAQQPWRAWRGVAWRGVVWRRVKEVRGDVHDVHDVYIGGTLRKVGDRAWVFFSVRFDLDFFGSSWFLFRKG